jgi:hypothetical protein
VILSHVGSTVKIVGRRSRIMPGDYLEYKRKSESIVCKCVGVSDYMNRVKVSNWQDGKWGKEHVVYNSDESYYRVITELAARAMEPGAFE